MSNAQEYAKGLARKQNKENALKIAEECLKASSINGTITLFDEADFYVQTEKTSFPWLELSKTQSSKVAKQYRKRFKSNVNFWTEVVAALKGMQ